MTKVIDIDKMKKHLSETRKDILKDSKIQIEKTISLLDSNEPDKELKCSIQLKEISEILTEISKQLAESADELKPTSIIDELVKSVPKSEKRRTL